MSPNKTVSPRSVGVYCTFRTLAIVCIGAVFSTSALAQCLSGPPAPRLPSGLKLMIRAEKTVAEISRPTIIHFEISNESDKPISLTDRLFPERDYEVHVRDSNGKEAQLTERGRQLRHGPLKGSQTTAVLAPGERYTDKEDLAKLYTISVPGTYSIEVCRDIQMWGNIYSNRITLPFVVPANQ